MCQNYDFQGQIHKKFLYQVQKTVRLTEEKFHCENERVQNLVVVVTTLTNKFCHDQGNYRLDVKIARKTFKTLKNKKINKPASFYLFLTSQGLVFLFILIPYCKGMYGQWVVLVQHFWWIIKKQWTNFQNVPKTRTTLFFGYCCQTPNSTRYQLNLNLT